MPSIFCSTHGPRFVSVVVPALIVCHGHENFTLGRWTLTPTRWNAADSAISTTAAIALRNTRPTTSTAAAHLIPSGMRRRRGPPGPPFQRPGAPSRPEALGCHGGTGTG